MVGDHGGGDGFEAALTDLEDALTDFLNATDAACHAVNNALALAPPGVPPRRVRERPPMTPATVRAVGAYLASRSPAAGAAVVTSEHELVAALGAAARALAKGGRTERRGGNAPRGAVRNRP